MMDKFIREAVSVVVGKQAEEIASLLDNKSYVNEFIIAKKMDITINQARNILYKLSEYGLVSSIRKKDKKKGWYTYYWKVESLKILEFLKGILENKIFQTQSQIKSRGTKTFYVCNKCNIEHTEENALAHDFTCQECGEIFNVKDNLKIIKEFEKQVDKLTQELSLINQEMKKENELFDKVKMKELKKVQKEEAKKREERKIARKKLEKKNPKNIKKAKKEKNKKKKSKTSKSHKKTSKKSSKKNKAKKKRK